MRPVYFFLAGHRLNDRPRQENPVEIDNSNNFKQIKSMKPTAPDNQTNLKIVLAPDPGPFYRRLLQRLYHALFFRHSWPS